MAAANVPCGAAPGPVSHAPRSSSSVAGLPGALSPCSRPARPSCARSPHARADSRRPGASMQQHPRARAACAAAVADVAQLAAPLSLPLLEVAVLAGAWAAARLALGLRMAYVTAAMLSRSVPRGGARVLQLGGDVKQLYYYPRDTVLVSVAAPKLRRALWEQAGVQAGVPVSTHEAARLAGLPFQASASVDAVVSSGALGALDSRARSELAAGVLRVLKPGGAFILVERGGAEGAAAAVQGALRPFSARLGLQALEALLALPGFEGATYDVALAGLDAHIVAFARKQPAGEARARGAAAEAPGRRAGRKGFAASRRD